MILDTLRSELENLDVATATREQRLWAYALLSHLALSTGYYPGLFWVDEKINEIEAALKSQTQEVSA